MSGSLVEKGLLDLLEDPAQDHSNDPSDNCHHVGGRLPGEISCSRIILYEHTDKRVSKGRLLKEDKRAAFQPSAALRRAEETFGLPTLGAARPRPTERFRRDFDDRQDRVASVEAHEGPSVRV